MIQYNSALKPRNRHFRRLESGPKSDMPRELAFETARGQNDRQRGLAFRSGVLPPSEVVVLIQNVQNPAVGLENGPSIYFLTFAFVYQTVVSEDR